MNTIKIFLTLLVCMFLAACGGGGSSSSAPDAPTASGLRANSSVLPQVPLTGKALVSFTAPASNGGSAITGYIVTANPGGITYSGSFTDNPDRADPTLLTLLVWLPPTAREIALRPPVQYKKL